MWGTARILAGPRGGWALRWCHCAGSRVLGVHRSGTVRWAEPVVRRTPRGTAGEAVVSCESGLIIQFYSELSNALV